MKNSVDTELARKIRLELSEADPRGEFDLAKGKQLFIDRMVFDIESAKQRVADSAFRAISHDQPRLDLDGQKPLPGMPPEEGSYIPLGDERWAHAPRVVLDQIIEWHQYEEDQVEKRQRRERAVKARTRPLLSYFLRGMNWAGAADAYRADHPEEATG